MVSVPCKKNCVCGPFHNAGKINYPLWWYGDQGILYNFAGGSATPNGCVFKDHGYWFDGTDDYLIDEQGRKILREGTEGLWSSINLDCNNPPPCGSVSGSGVELCLSDGGALPPDLTGSLVLHQQHCPNLTVLRCERNAITELDIVDMVSLTYLRCYDNLISAADIAALTALTYLHCYTNSLTMLNVAALTALTFLNCGNNSISALDVSNLTSLTELHCQNNTISVLDVAALTSLTRLYCYNGSISILDVSNLTSLTDLRCETNSMNQAMVDTVLCDMDGHGTNNGTINISSNAVPSATGVACKNNLVGRGWSVTTD